MFPPRLTYSLGLASAVQCDEFLTLTDGSVRGISGKNINNPDRAARQRNSSFNLNKYWKGERALIALPRTDCLVTL